MPNREVEKVLSILHQKKPMSDAAGEDEFEKRMKQARVACMTVAIACWPILIMVAGILGISPHRSAGLADMGRVVGMLMLMTAIAWPVLDTLPVLRSLIRFSTQAFERGKRAFQHDFQNTDELLDVDLPILELTDKWLQLGIERMKLRIGIFLGGSDKVAVFALAGTGWTVWHNLPTMDNFGSSWQDLMCAAPLAVMAGFAIGGMFVNALIQKWSYQRDLLAIAIKRKTMQEAA